MEKFIIEYEIADIEYNNVCSCGGCLCIKIENPLSLQLTFLKEDFNDITGLNWDGSKEQIEELKKILVGKKFGLDLGIKEGLAMKQAEKNKIIIKFPKDMDIGDASKFYFEFVYNKNIEFYGGLETIFDEYRKNNIFVLFVPCNKEKEIIGIINAAGNLLGIKAMPYKEYVKEIKQ